MVGCKASTAGMFSSGKELHNHSVMDLTAPHSYEMIVHDHMHEVKCVTGIHARTKMKLLHVKFC